MKGSYVLIVRLDEDRSISIGKLGKIFFRRGYYLYVGSALNSLEGRIMRHLSNKKRLHWHIDYLLNGGGRISKIYIKKSDEKEECEIAHTLSRKLDYIPGFGSSDCRCKSHLFYSHDERILDNILRSVGMIIFYKDGKII